MVSKIIAHRSIIWSLAKNDFKSRYLGSVLGSLWAFVLPLVNLTIMWFAFNHGLRVSPIKEIPLILWLITGLFPWTFFSDGVTAAMNSILNKSFLVKKVVFDVEVLPLIQVLASSVVFVFLIFVMLGIFIAYGFFPTLYWLQLFYYVFCLAAIVLSLSWLTSSVVVFYRDLGQLISVGLQLGFWVTPIFWSTERLPENFKFIIYLNPVTYIISGYRDSLIQQVWFWQKPKETIIFWCIVLFFTFTGLHLFKKLRPHFADVI